MDILSEHIIRSIVEGKVKLLIKTGKEDEAIKYLKKLLKQRGKTADWLHPWYKELLAKIIAEEARDGRTR